MSQEESVRIGNMNVPIKILRNLKLGKAVFVPDIAKRHAILHMLDAFKLPYKQDGGFLSLVGEAADQ